MTDLTNHFEQWGDSGVEPTTDPDGSVDNYNGGDNVFAKHFDFLWHEQYETTQLLIDAILDRIRDLHGDLVLDGLKCTEGSNSLEVDVGSSSGAYVDGQFTGSVSSTTISLSSNGSGSTRTDTIWMDEDGQIGKNEGSTTVSNSGHHKIAEVDVDTNDNITIRNKAHDNVHLTTSENSPDNPVKGDIWYDKTENLLKSYDGSSWGRVLDIEKIEDTINQLLSAGSNIDISYNDSDDTLTISAPNEQIEDVVNQLLSAGNGINVSYNDSGDTLTISVDLSDINVENLPTSGDKWNSFKIDENKNVITSKDILQPFGDSVDGSITDSSNKTRGGVLRTSDYTLEAGNTLSIDKLLIIHAQDKITINGTIDAKGSGGVGGSGGSSDSGGSDDAGDGGDGENAIIRPTGTGGSGGSGGSYDGISGGNGGDGGDGKDRAIKYEEQFEYLPTVSIYTLIRETSLSPKIGAGAGGGGGAKSHDEFEIDNVSGANGNYPSGGGGGGIHQNVEAIPSGSAGGNGGGAIILCAPTIEINGTIDASGEDGEDGVDDEHAGSGAGGGGNGGLIAYIYRNTIDRSSAIENVSAGSGGVGGTDTTDGDSDGGDGANGESGWIKSFQI